MPPRKTTVTLITCALAAVLTGGLAAGQADPTPAVVSLGINFIHIVGPSLVLMGVGIVMARALDGAGNTVPAMVINLITLWCIEVGAGYALSRWLRLGPTGVWWGRAIAQFSNGLLFAFWFWRGKWKEKEV